MYLLLTKTKKMNIHKYEKKETILKLENISLKLGDTQILSDINIEVKDIVRPEVTQGQIISLLAPSGVGKTKLFEIISGIIKPTAGVVQVGHPLEPIKIGRVGVVQQNYPLFNHRTVYGNLNVAAKLKYKDKKERQDKIDEILKKFNLEKHKNFYPAQLSGGQKQRVGIAQQILCSNNFLLMDEPFSGLDINMIHEVQKMILEIANMNEYNTIIVVTHDISAAATISDTLWIMGRDRDQSGNIIPGAKIKYEIDLIEMGLAWRENISTLPEFHKLVDDIKQLFPNL